MSDKVLCEKQDLVTIANAVREAANITDNFNVPSLVEKTCEVLAEGGTKLLPDLNAVNGGTAATTMAAAVDNAEAHASSQEALIAQIMSVLDGKAAGGSGSNVYEVKEGPLTYTTSMGGPGEAPTYFLRADGIIPTQTDIMIVYVVETVERRVTPYDIFVRTIPFVAVINGTSYQLNSTSYTVSCNGDMLAYSDYIKLENTSINNTNKDTFNEFKYITVIKKQEVS